MIATTPKPPGGKPRKTHAAHGTWGFTINARNELVSFQGYFASGSDEERDRHFRGTKTFLEYGRFTSVSTDGRLRSIRIAGRARDLEKFRDTALKHHFFKPPDEERLAQAIIPGLESVVEDRPELPYSPAPERIAEALIRKMKWESREGPDYECLVATTQNPHIAFQVGHYLHKRRLGDGHFERMKEEIAYAAHDGQEHLFHLTIPEGYMGVFKHEFPEIGWQKDCSDKGLEAILAGHQPGADRRR